MSPALFSICTYIEQIINVMRINFILFHLLFTASDICCLLFNFYMKLGESEIKNNNTKPWNVMQLTCLTEHWCNRTAVFWEGSLSFEWLVHKCKSVKALKFGGKFKGEVSKEEILSWSMVQTSAENAPWVWWLQKRRALCDIIWSCL